MLHSIHCRGRRHSPFRHGHRARWMRRRCRTAVPVVIAILCSVLHTLGPIESWWRCSFIIGTAISLKSSWRRWWWRWERHGQQHLVCMQYLYLMQQRSQGGATATVCCSETITTTAPFVVGISPSPFGEKCRNGGSATFISRRNFAPPARSIQSRYFPSIRILKIEKMDRHDQKVESTLPYNSV
jgi:hypothetical protein